MKITAAAAIGALILAASAVPALAGGYWDGGIVQSGPPGGPPGYCPPARQDYSDDDRRGWRDESGWSASERGDGRSWDDERYRGDESDWSDQQDDDSGWRDGADFDDADDYAPAEYSDGGFYDVGPSYVVDGGGAGGFVNSGPFIGLGFDFRDRGRDHFRDHDRFRDHDHFSDRDRHAAYSHVMQRDHQSYPQHTGGWGPMQPHQPMQGYHPTHMIASYGHTGGYGHPAAHSGGHRR